VATQIELPIREAAVLVEGCKVHTLQALVEEGGSSTCARCAVVEALRQRRGGAARGIQQVTLYFWEWEQKLEHSRNCKKY